MNIKWPWSKEPDIAVAIKNEVEAALQQLNVNSTSDVNGIRQRIGQAISGGYDYADTMHNIYLDYGYAQTLTFFQFWNMYRRFGIAKNIVELPVDVGWTDNPIVEGSDQFNRDLEQLVNNVKLWDRLKSLDTRQRVGRYAGLFIRVRDGKQPSEPLEGKLPGVNAVISLIPIYEGQLKVSATDSDPMSDSFGLPTMYEFSSGSTGNRNEEVNASVNIHPSRIVIASEDADNGGIYGISSLEAPYNSLLDLRKIIGAGGEGFYRNAAQNIVHSLKDGASAKGNEKLLEAMNEQTDDFLQNRFRRSMWTPGMDSKVLESNLANPKEFFANALNDVSAATKIPATILIGQQTGRLASTEDSKHFRGGLNSRRENWMTELVESVIDWFILNGVLPSSEYTTEWSDLLALSQEDKLANGKTMSEINEREFKSGGDRPFSTEEIREESGFDPEEIEEGNEDGVEPVEEETE